MFRKNMRCLLTLTLAVLMLFSLAACGVKEADENANVNGSAKVNLTDNDDGVVRYSGEVTFGYDNGSYPPAVIQGGASVGYAEEEEEEEIPQLTDGIALDVFPIIEQFIVYSGGNGGGRIELEIPEGYYQEMNGCYFKRHDYSDDKFEIVFNNEVIGGFEIALYMIRDDYSKQYYSNGDVFEVSITRTEYGSYKGGAHEDYVNEYIYKHGFFLPQTKKYYTVSGLGEYITSYTQLSAAELEDIKNYVINHKFENSYCNVADFKGCYEGKIKPFATEEPGSRFVIYIGLYCVRHQGKMYENTEYTAVAVDEIIRKPDGSLSFELYNGWSLFSSGETLEEMEENILNNETYDFVKIG